MGSKACASLVLSEEFSIRFRIFLHIWQDSFARELARNKAPAYREQHNTEESG